eukprot:1025-Heterococcus_DN1.PRE.1
MLIFISPRCYCVILVRAIQFPNCLPFTGEREFSANVWRALSMTPQPLTPEQRYSLSWTAATQRLIDSSKCALRSVISCEDYCTSISGCTDRVCKRYLQLRFCSTALPPTAATATVATAQSINQ